MSKFGWSYPPGAASDPFAPYNQEEGPCEVCGNDVDHCTCHECPTCGTVGDPACYEKHGLKKAENPEYTPGVTWPTEYCGEVWASTWKKEEEK